MPNQEASGRPPSVDVTGSGPVAVGGDVTITGTVAAGRDVIIERLTLVTDDSAPFGDAAARPETTTAVCPYPGIQPFAEDQRAYFVGRDRDRRAVLDLLDRAPFVAVVGGSGSGKSSLLAAGITPDFIDARKAEGEEWLARSLRPGRAPMDRLERLMASPAGGRVIWVVDQLEEVFGREVDVGQRAQFLERLGEIADGVHGTAKVLVALRSDFYPALDDHRPTADAVAAHQHRLLPMDAESLRDVIVLPAEQVGLRVEPALIEHVLADVEPGTNQLPLMAFALRETWRRRRNGWLTLAGYVEAGGIGEALENGARSVWNGLDEQQRATARRIFLRLTSVGEGRAATKQRATVEGLVTEVDDLDSIVEVLERFTRERLIVPDQDEHGRPTVDIAHEALLREWSVLREWLAEDVDVQRLQREVAGAAQSWDGGGRESTGLLGGRRLQAVQEARRAGTITLNDTEQDFLSASSRRASRDRRRTVLLVVLPLVLVAAIAVVGLVVAQQRRTAEQKTVADGLQLAAEARSLAATRRDAAALLAVAALRTDDNGTTLGTLIDTVSSPDGPLAFPRLAGATATALATSLTDDGAVVVGGSDGSLRSLDSITGREVSRTDLTLTSVATIARADDGTIVAGGNDGAVAVVVGGAGAPLLLRGPTRPVRAVAYSMTARIVIAGTADGELWRWSLADGGAVLPTVSLDEGMLALALVADQNPDTDDLIVMATTAGRLVRVDVVTGDRQLPVIDNAFAGSAISLAPAGDELFVLDGTGMRGWAMGPDGDDDEPTSVSDETSGSTSLALSPSGDLAFTGTTSGEIATWTLDPRPILVGPGRAGLEGPIEGVATDGATVVALDGVGHLVSWDVEGRRNPAAVVRVVHDSGVLAVDTAPDGSTASGDRNGVVRITTPAGVSRTIADLDASVTGVAWLTGNEIVVSSRDGGVVRIDATAGTSTQLQPPGDVPIVGVASDGADRVVFAAEDGNVSVLGGTTTWHLVAAEAPVLSVAMTSDGTAVAVGSGGSGSTVSMWDLDDDDPQPQVLSGHTRQVTSLAFSAEGELLASGSDDQEIRLWAVPSGEERGRLVGHTDMVQALAFTSDGLLVSGAEDFTVRVWDVEDRSSVGRPWRWDDGPIWGLSIAPDGRSVAVANATSIVDWALGRDGWTRTACRLAGRELTTAEWSELAPGRPVVELCADTAD